jgi:hypothetical protein
LPEFGVAMGKPLVFGEHIRDYLVVPGTDLGVAAATGIVYARPYEAGVVLVNPSILNARAQLSRSGYVVRAEGGGWIGGDGSLPPGNVTYESVEIVELPSQSGALVVWTIPGRD